MTFRFAALFCAVLVCEGPGTAVDDPRRSADGGEILIGIEYAMPGPAKVFAELGVPAVKYYPDEITWGKMQPTKEAAIDFRLMDRFVREYEDAGFQELMIVLKSASPWASRHARTNLVPKPEFMPLYAAWVRATVERYDGDGKDDMPGLKRPVRYFEIGSEFSTFEPEPAAEYLEMLEQAYRSAHEASETVSVLHAAFLTTTVFKDDPKPNEYETAFEAVKKRTGGRILNKSLADLRSVLNRPQFFDVVNFHALGDPYEIEDIAAWLRFEMKKRGYAKPLIISDTTPTPLIAWGPATRADGPAQSLGIVVPPAIDADRPRLAEYFTKLVDGDTATVEWTHGFVAREMVKKVVVAAEQRITLINTSFMEDLTLFKTKSLKAGAGTSAWAGMADAKINLLNQSRSVTGRRPLFYAIQRLQRQIKGYASVERVRVADKRIRLYRFAKQNRTVWIGWLEPDRMLLPGDEPPTTSLTLEVTGPRVTVEPLIDRAGQTEPEKMTVNVTSGSVRLVVSNNPLYVIHETKE